MLSENCKFLCRDEKNTLYYYKVELSISIAKLRVRVLACNPSTGEVKVGRRWEDQEFCHPQLEGVPDQGCGSPCLEMKTKQRKKKSQTAAGRVRERCHKMTCVLVI